MPAVALKNLTKTFDAGTPALDRLSLEVEGGEFLVLLGPSGCGKTTVLRCIAGLEQPTAGDIMIGEERVNDLPPGDRDVAMVFQNYALYPHLTVRDNIAFPLRMRRVPRADIGRRVGEAAALLGLEALLDRRPWQLSGGERQRTALGRAIVRRPKVFLFDEPLSNLDAGLRAAMRAELVALHRRLAAAMLYVTHDQTEAMTMGRRIAVLRAGVLQQIGTPADLYARPANSFVAAFVGAPGMNLIGGSEDRGSLGPRDRVSDGPSTGAGSLGFRPEDARIGPVMGALAAGTVRLVEPLGSETLVHLTLERGEAVVCRLREGVPPALETRVGVHVAPEKLHRFDASGARLD